jgi:hypothetical protein
MKQNLLKTMLVSTALVAGTMGVWADEVIQKYDFEDGVALFSADSRVTVAVEDDADLKSKVVSFTAARNAQNGYSFAHHDFSSLVKGAKKVTVSFDFWNTNGGRSIVSLGDAETRGATGGSSKVTYNGTGALFRIGSDKNYFYVNNKALALASYCGKWLKVSVTVDVVGKKLSYTIADKEGNELYSQVDADYYNSASSCSQIDVFGYINNSKMAMIDNLSITAEIDASVNYYSANFSEETGLTPDVKVFSDADCLNEVPANSVQENTKYYYVATLAGYEDYKGEFTVASENPSVSFTMVKKPVFAYKVNLVDEANNVLKTVYENDEAYEGLEVNYSYPKYLTDENGKVTYVCSLSSFNGSVNAHKDAVTSVKYNEYKGTAYFVEAENAINKAKVENANYSSGAAMRGFNTNMDLFTVPETGVYRLSYAVCSNNVGQNRQFFVYADDDEIVNKGVQWSVNKVTTDGTITEAAMTFNEGTVIKAKGSDTNIILDYILLEKVTSEDVAVSAIKFATYVPTCNVVAPADVKVYTAKVNEAKSAVVLTEVSAGSVIAKGTPVLVGAEEGSYTFAASADEATTVADNDLKAATADTKGDGATIYALVEQDGKAVFAPLKEGVAVSLGHAYLELPAASATRFYSIQFGGETTGINEVNAAAKADGAYYTLQGVKTSKAAKGIYIHNGKKVVIK